MFLPIILTVPCRTPHSVKFFLHIIIFFISIMRQRGIVNMQKMIKDRRRQRAALHPRRKEVQHLRRAHTPVAYLPRPHPGGAGH
nr:MAG TPA: hypothetical protein [Caudoviricetes sp.]